MSLFLDRVNRLKIEFINKYGENKLRKITSKIYSSKKIRRMLQTSVDKQLAPSKNDYLYTLNEMPYFIFSKPDTLALGAIITLELWHNYINKDYCFLNEHDLDYLLEEIVRDCEQMKIR